VSAAGAVGRRGTRRPTAAGKPPLRCAGAGAARLLPTTPVSTSGPECPSPLRAEPAQREANRRAVLARPGLSARLYRTNSKINKLHAVQDTCRPFKKSRVPLRWVISVRITNVDSRAFVFRMRTGKRQRFLHHGTCLSHGIPGTPYSFPLADNVWVQAFPAEAFDRVSARRPARSARCLKAAHFVRGDGVPRLGPPELAWQESPSKPSTVRAAAPQ
jgi:hypothetical protein